MAMLTVIHPDECTIYAIARIIRLIEVRFTSEIEYRAIFYIVQL